MKTVRRSAIVARPVAEVFHIVADVARYPEFVPGCRAVRIESSSMAEVVATLEIRKGPLATSFTTRNRLEPPSRIDLSLVSGPFRALEGLWSLAPLGEEGCRIGLELRFEFGVAFPSVLFDPIFEQLAAELVDAFVRRARSAPRGDDGEQRAGPGDAAP